MCRNLLQFLHDMFQEVDIEVSLRNAAVAKVATVVVWRGLGREKGEQWSFVRQEKEAKFCGKDSTEPLPLFSSSSRPAASSSGRVGRDSRPYCSSSSRVVVVTNSSATSSFEAHMLTLACTYSQAAGSSFLRLQ